MLATDVPLHVALLLAAVGAVRAREGGLLATLALLVHLEVALVAVSVAAAALVQLVRQHQSGACAPRRRPGLGPRQPCNMRRQ